MTTTTTTLSELTGDYVLDQAGTRMGFAIRQAMVSTVHGRFEEFEGHLHLDGDDPTRSTARITISAESLRTGNDRRDAHVRGSFLHTAHHPTITFTSTEVEYADPGAFTVTGELTMGGVTKPLTVDFELTGAKRAGHGAVRAEFEGAANLNRKDWNVVWNAFAEGGGAFVGYRVMLELDITATRLS